MYRSYYNLAEKPFKLTADPKFLWLGEKHKEALATLKYGVIDQKGFILVSGDVGTGKTTLINALLESIDENILVANIKDPALNLIDFLNFIAISFDIPQKFTNKVDFIVYFSQFLKKAYSEDKCVLLIIDEVHSLSKELLEHIRLLSNIELPEEKLINIFFVGQNEIHQTLALPECRAIRQRISLAYQIKPLSESETCEYIKHRLKIAGTEKHIFTEGAVREIYHFSNGYPRLVNIICDLSLLTGYSQDLKKITPAVVLECSQEYNFINNTIENTPLNSKQQHHPEFRLPYIKCPFKEVREVEDTFSGKTETQVMSSSQPAIIRESSNLKQETRYHDNESVIAAAAKQIRKKLFPRTGPVSFASRWQKTLLSRATAVPFTGWLRKRWFFWVPAAFLTLIIIVFAGFSQKEDALKDRGQKPADSEFNLVTTSAVKADSHIILETPEKKIAKIPSGQSQKTSPTDASKTLKPTTFELAKKSLDHRDFSRAVELFEQAMAQNPTNAPAIKTYYSEALREQAETVLVKDPYTSKKLLVKAVEADPKNAGAFFDLGKLHTKSKDYKKAIIAYQEAANLNYRSSDAYYNLGFIYATTKEFAVAEKMFLRVVDLKPQYLDKVLFNLAVVQQKQGKKRQCIESLEKAMKINPDNQRARQYLQRLKNDKGMS
jgi:type II secretory pathway predicted ATPase ExeA/tetratricopeptide (TPR) repeat protein